MPIESLQTQTPQKTAPTLTSKYNKHLLLRINNIATEIVFVNNQKCIDNVTIFHDVKADKLDCLKIHSSKTSVKCMLDVSSEATCSELQAHHLTTNALTCDSIDCQQLEVKSLKVPALSFKEAKGDKLQAGSLDAQSLRINELTCDIINTGRLHGQDARVGRIECENFIAPNIQADRVDVGVISEAQLIVSNNHLLTHKRGVLACQSGKLHWADITHVSFIDCKLTINAFCVDMPTMHHKCNTNSTIFGSVKTTRLSASFCKADIETDHIKVHNLDGGHLDTDDLYINACLGNVNARHVLIGSLTCTYENNKVTVQASSATDQHTFTQKGPHKVVDAPVSNHDVSQKLVSFENLRFDSNTSKWLEADEIAAHVVCDSITSKTANSVTCNDLCIDSLPLKCSIVSLDHKKLKLIDETYVLNFPVDHQTCNDEYTKFEGNLSCNLCTSDQVQTKQIDCDQVDIVYADRCTFIKAETVHTPSVEILDLGKHRLVLGNASEKLLQYKQGVLRFISNHEHKLLVGDVYNRQISSCVWPFAKQCTDDETTYFDCDVRCNDFVSDLITAHVLNSETIECSSAHAHQVHSAELSVKNLHCAKIIAGHLNESVRDQSDCMNVQYLNGFIIVDTRDSQCKISTPFKNQTADEHKTAFKNVEADVLFANEGISQYANVGKIITDQISSQSLSSEELLAYDVYTKSISTATFSLPISYDLQHIQTGKDIVFTYNNMVIKIEGWPLRHVSSVQNNTNFAHTLSVGDLITGEVECRHLKSIGLNCGNCGDAECLVQSSEIECDSDIAASDCNDCNFPFNLPCDLPNFDAMLVCDGESVFWEPISQDPTWQN